MTAKQPGWKAGKSLRRVSIVSALAGSMAIVLGSAAKADVLPPPTFLESADVDNVVTNNDLFGCAGSAVGINCGGSGTGTIGRVSAFANATTTLLNPAVGPLTISSFAHGGQSLDASASGDADYYLELVGPAPVSPTQTIGVRVDFTAQADVSLSDPSEFVAGALGRAGLDIFRPNGQNVEALGAVPSDVTASAGSLCLDVCTSSDSFSGSLLFFLQPNVQYLVDVFTSVGTTDSRFGPVGNSFQTASAEIDPHFFQDPEFGNPLYTLDLSPGISNDLPGVAAVPEPSSWEMLGIGIGLLGLLPAVRARIGGSVRPN